VLPSCCASAVHGPCSASICSTRWLNSGAILTYNNAFVPGGTWLQPITILTGRMAKFSAEFTF